MKENGKWDDISVLNTTKLSTQFKSGNWDAGFKEKISSFSHEEETITVTVLKKKQ
ncbi:hypothetical protein [Methanolobus sp. WCC5]|uniref:hypothetical protein n=1 Tax=Methanolobus sp. WCC5 TaxID=3125785 RepID=UPI003251F2BB